MEELRTTIKVLEQNVTNLEYLLASEKLGRARDIRELSSQLRNVRTAFSTTVGIFTVENFNLKTLLIATTENEVECYRKVAGMREDIAKLNKRISTLEEENHDLHSWLRFQEGEKEKDKTQAKELKEKLTRIESKAIILESKSIRWERNHINAVIRQLVLDLERKVRVFLISHMDSSEQEEFFYRDDHSLNVVRVDQLEYRNVIQNNPQLRQKLLQEFFPGYESERRYRTFCVTMRDMKALFNAVAHPVGDLDGNPITNTSICQYLEASTLSQEVKLAAKEFVAWLYP